MSDVQITFKATDQTSAAARAVQARMEAIRGQLKGLMTDSDLTGRKAQDIVQPFESAFSKIGAAMFGVGVAAYAAKKALDFGEQGAEVIQTAESFNYLTQKISLSDGTLQKLREASKGTVDDMTLMGSTLTMLAGTQGEVSKRFVEAAPQLMEIAKAANKLNPTLGDTTKMYESIANGIKRSSPLILDNLGIIVKVGEANKKYAESINKNVDELTAEEKQMALLNAVLEKGKTMIEQVGGNTDSATDSFEKFNASVKNLKDEMATGLVPAATDVVKWLNKVKEITDFRIGRKMSDDFKLENDQLIINSGTYEEYVQRLGNAAVAHEMLSQGFVSHILSSKSAEAASREFLGVTREEYEWLNKLMQPMNLSTEQYARYTGSAGQATLAAQGLRSNLQELALTEQELNAIEAESADKASFVRDQFAAQADAAGLAAQSFLGYAESLKGASETQFVVAATNAITASMREAGASEADIAAMSLTVAKQFGLVDERSMALAQNMLTAGGLITQGSLPIAKTGDYLDIVYKNAGKSDQKIQDFLKTTLKAPDQMAPAIDATDRWHKKFLSLDESSHNALTNIATIMTFEPTEKDFYVTIHQTTVGDGGGSKKNNFRDNPTFGAASGGSFDVSNRGGSSATDRSLVSFWATPGEHVEISPAGTRRAGGGGDIIITGNNIYGTDPDDIARALARQLNLQGVNG